MSNTYQPMMEAIEKLAKDFGAKLRTSESEDPTCYNAAIRQYNDARGYMAITRPEEPLSHGYSALSFVVFPLMIEDKGNGNSTYTCLVSIGIGTSDLGEDEELAALPYFRRSYTKLLPRTSKSKGFIKTSFTDNTTDSVTLFKVLQEGAEKYGWDLTKIERYKKLLPAAIILSFTDSDIKSVTKYLGTKEYFSVDNDFKILAAWLAQYAKIRGWNFNSKGNNVINRQDNAIIAVNTITQSTDASIQADINNLVNYDSYVVLQGAPGTGKTRAAIEFAKANHYKVFFTQFHAETTYADFVGGIRPILNGENVGYEYIQGIFTDAIQYAIGHPEEKILLIIDEINRANLANVVGPMFYLLERGVNSKPVDRSVAPLMLQTKDAGQLKLSSLPHNLKIIATMNTSDRSLAMVDFALRRRFVWYTMPVLNLFAQSPQEKLFMRISELFDKYATDEELSLQPGHSYFFVKDMDEMHHRLEYEIMPLMKEYFANGLLLAARDEFADIFFQEIGKFMYR